jgi:hypothetical protein
VGTLPRSPGGSTIRSVEALTAAAAGLAPIAPPAEWFADPQLHGPTALTITDEGRVFGHAATWNVCHIGFPGECVTAPRSPSGYRFFHLGEVETVEGERISCGQITLGTGHAPLKLASSAAAEHYDNTGTCAVDVRCGDDRHGIWVAGALRPDISAERARELRGAKLSGDWRGVNGQRELVGLLAVNVPGFPVPRLEARVASGEMVALVAAGVVTEETPLSPSVARSRIRAKAARALGRDQLLAAALGNA